MATKNLVPRGDQEGKLGLSDRRWLGINAVSGSFSDIKTNDLKNSAGNQLIIGGSGITISGPSDPDSGSGAQYTISADDLGNSNAQVDRIFAGPEVNDVTQQQQAVIAEYDANDSSNSKLTFKTNNQIRWTIDNAGHYIPETNPATQNLGSASKYPKNIFISNASGSGHGLIFVNQSNSHLSSLSIKNDRLSISSFKSSSVDSNTKYDNILIRKESVRASTVDEIDSSYDSNNYTLTSSSNGVISIDGISDFALNQRVLVKDQTTASENGIYIVTTLGDSNNPFVLTRSNDLSSGIDFSGIFVESLEGTINSNKIFYSTSNTTNSILDTDGLIWNDFKSGLKNVVEDSSPELGADLDILGHKIKSSTSEIQILPQNVSTNEGILIDKNNIKINFVSASNPNKVIPTLSLSTSATKNIHIKSVPEASFFTGDRSALSDFTYTFNPSSLTSTENSNGEAYFATESWVSSQITNSQQDVSGFISSGSDASLDSLIITGAIADSGQTNDDVGISFSSTNKRIIGLASPVSANDAANKSYVDNIAQGLNVKNSVRVATNGSNISISGDLNDQDQIDGVILATGDRVLVKDQSTSSENGIYIVGATPVRSNDLASSSSAAGIFVFVEEGTENADQGFVCTSDSGSDVVGTDDLNFSQFSGAGTIIGGAGLTKSGNNLSVNVKSRQLNGSDNPDSLIYIDSDTLDLDVTRLIPKLNDATGLEADTFVWPTTNLTGSLEPDDKIIISDVSEDPDSTKSTTILSLKQNILNVDPSDITFTYDPNANPDPTWEANLTDTAISDKPELQDSNSQPDKPHNDDLVLITDVSAPEGEKLKKVKYSNFLKDISSAPNFSNINDIADDDLSWNDKLIIVDDSDSATKKLTFSKIALKTKYISSIDQSDAYSLYTGHRYIIKRLSSPTNNIIKLNIENIKESGSTDAPGLGDRIQIVILPSSIGSNRKSSIGQKLVEITDVRSNATLKYNWLDLQKNNTIEFFHDGTNWNTKDVKRENDTDPGHMSISELQTELENYTERFVRKEYFIGDIGSSLELDLPDPPQGNELLRGDKIKVYLANVNIEKITITNENGNIARSYDNGVSNYTNRMSAIGEKILNFRRTQDSDIPYFEIELVRTKAGDGNGSVWRWNISSPYNKHGEEESFTPPEANAYELIKRNNNDTSWISGKIENVNISTGAITGGVDANNAATGSIAASTIVGGNIASNTVALTNLKTINNKKVLGSLLNSGGDPNNPSNPVTEINILDSHTDAVASSAKNTNLITWSAIKDYVDRTTGQSTSEVTEVVYNAYSGDANPDPSRPNTVIINENDALGSSNILIINNVQSGFGSQSPESFQKAFLNGVWLNYAGTENSSFPLNYLNPDNIEVNNINNQSPYPNGALQATINIKLPRIENWIANRGFDPLEISYKTVNVASPGSGLSSGRYVYSGFRFIPNDLDLGSYSTYGGNSNSADEYVQDNPQNKVPVYMNGKIGLILRNNQDQPSDFKAFMYDEANAAIISELTVSIVKKLRFYPVRAGSIEQFIGNSASRKITVENPYVWSVERV